MDSDDLVIIDAETPMSVRPSSVAHRRLGIRQKHVDSDEESESDTHSHPIDIIHTTCMTRRINKYRYHNYLKNTNDNCAVCHELLLQAYREEVFDSSPPPPLTAFASSTFPV